MLEAFVRPTVDSEKRPLYHLPDYPTRPIDEITGLPYCFAPNPELPLPLQRGSNHADPLLRIADWDHQFPRVETMYGANPVLAENNGRMALMNLRVQWSTYTDHHGTWNNASMVGPMQPRTPQQLAATLVFGLSGYIPELCLDLRHRKVQEKRLDDESRRFLWVSGQVRVANESDVLMYLRAFVYSQKLDHLNDSVLDEFLHTYDLEKRIYLAHSLAAKIIERAVEPLDAAYTSVRKRGLLHAGGGSASEPPQNPRDLLKQKLVRRHRPGRVVNELQQLLGARARNNGSAA